MKLFSELVTVAHPNRKIKYNNKGIGGNRITDLKNRWEDDVMNQKFDWLSVMIGINDCASHIRQAPDAVDPDIYRQTYTELLERTLAEHPCKLVLLDPFYISNDHDGNSIRSRFLNTLPEYIKTVHALSRKHDSDLVKTHDIFQGHLKYRQADFFAPEPVHPYHIGHLTIAHALMGKIVE